MYTTSTDSTIWATKTALSVEEIKQSLSYIKTYRLSVAKLDFTHFNKSAESAKLYHVSVYDSMYAVYAEEKNCILFMQTQSSLNRQISLL